MLNNSRIDSYYQATPAYDLRGFAKRRRYKTSDVSIQSVALNAACRAEVEGFIASVFKQNYGAKVTDFMPDLVALRDQQGELMGAFGLRQAVHEPLFLEQYIDEPIEDLMTRQLATPIRRDEVTCIGNLAVANPRNASVLIAHVIQHSLDLGIEWCVATAHHSLQNGVIKGGRDVYPLHNANKTSLPKDLQAAWGSYFDKTPQIVAIRGKAEYSSQLETRS